MPRPPDHFMPKHLIAYLLVCLMFVLGCYGKREVPANLKEGAIPPITPDKNGKMPTSGGSGMPKQPAAGGPGMPGTPGPGPGMPKPPGK